MSRSYHVTFLGKTVVAQSNVRRRAVRNALGEHFRETGDRLSYRLLGGSPCDRFAVYRNGEEVGRGTIEPIRETPPR